MTKTSAALQQSLEQIGFQDTGVQTTWRRHNMWLGYCELMSRPVPAGARISIPGQTLDYVVLIKGQE